MSSPFDFSSQHAIITGAAGGIASETVRLFVEGGAVLTLADLTLESLERTVERLEIPRDRVHLVEYDAGSYESNNALVASAVARFGAIDHVIPCAGIYRDMLATDMTKDAWLQTIDINLNGVFWLLRAAIPEMRDGGSIVTISSIAAHRGSTTHSHYAATKAGLEGLGRSLVLELGSRGIRVNSVAPGIIATPMTSGLIASRNDELLRQNPLGRHGSPDEIASVIAFLASDAASFINGETLHVNGGTFMSA